jgi:hypothetical protein
MVFSAKRINDQGFEEKIAYFVEVNQQGFTFYRHEYVKNNQLPCERRVLSRKINIISQRCHSLYSAKMFISTTQASLRAENYKNFIMVGLPRE